MRKSVCALVSFYAAFPLVAAAQHSDGHIQHKTRPSTAAKAAGRHDPAAHGHGPAHKPADAARGPSAAPGGGLEQTACPVTGEPVDAESSTTYEGRAVSFCCDDCIDTFKQDPSKYLPAVYRQIYPQRIQAACPVMGGAINTKVFVEHEGRKVYFCCRGCDEKFKKDPARYLPRLEESFSGQVHCPVSGQGVDSAHRVKEKDRTVYFCSKGCVEKYKADPAEYAKALLPEVGLLAYGPTAGEDLVAALVCPADTRLHKRREVESAVYRGKLYFLSGEACAKSFAADPASYVGILEKKSQPKSPGGAKVATGGAKRNPWFTADTASAGRGFWLESVILTGVGLWLPLWARYWGPGPGTDSSTAP